MSLFRNRKRDLELEVLHAVRALCKTEPDSTQETIILDVLRQKAEPWLDMIGDGPCR